MNSILLEEEGSPFLLLEVFHVRICIFGSLLCNFMPHVYLFLLKLCMWKIQVVVYVYSSHSTTHSMFSMLMLSYLAIILQVFFKKNSIRLVLQELVIIIYLHLFVI